MCSSIDTHSSTFTIHRNTATTLGCLIISVLVNIIQAFIYPPSSSIQCLDYLYNCLGSLDLLCFSSFVLGILVLTFVTIVFYLYIPIFVPSFIVFHYITDTRIAGLYGHINL